SRAGRGRSGGVATRSTREALLEQGALLFARHGVTGVSVKALHEAVGARNESALHYHFGSRRGLLTEILRVHLTAVERRRAVLADEIEATGRTGDLRALVHALAAPMADDLHDPVGRAHLRLVAQLSHPSLAYDEAFRSAREVEVDAAAGARVVRWLHAALPELPSPVRREPLAHLPGHQPSSFGPRPGPTAVAPGTATPGKEDGSWRTCVTGPAAGLPRPRWRARRPPPGAGGPGGGERGRGAPGLAPGGKPAGGARAGSAVGDGG